VAGRPIVKDGELRLAAVDEMLERHRRIALEWQQASG
jgi:hypothetical protein